MESSTNLSKGKILVLGASGFIGKNLYEYLLNKGYDVVGQQHSKINPDMVNCDLTDFELTKMLINGNDYIFMMAARTFGLGILKETPEALVRESIVMNANVLQACYELGVKKVFMVSSSVVYQDEKFQCLEEDDLDLNIDPYHLYQGIGWVKRYTEQLARFYSGLGLNVITVRPTGVYGKYDKMDEHKSHFIPAIIKKCLEANGTLEVWGSGKNVKDFIYIDDFVEDAVKLFEEYDSWEPLNMCSGDLHSIRYIVDRIVEIVGFRGDVIYDLNKPETIAFKSISNERINTIVKRREYTQLNEGLSKTIGWMKNDLTRNPQC